MTLEPDRIQTPDGELYENGQPCHDGQTGAVQVVVNGDDATEAFRDYAPDDGDRVEVYFR